MSWILTCVSKIEDCVLTDEENVVEDHDEYDYQGHPRLVSLEEPPTTQKGDL